MIVEQISSHLNDAQRTNQGAFYTPSTITGYVFKLLQKHLPNTKAYTLLDTSCGYGAFLKPPFNVNRIVGGDIDSLAVSIASKNTEATLVVASGLSGVGREAYGISQNEPLIIVGNPPYNDRTSLVKRTLKTESNFIHPSLKTRDLGLSFLLSYDKLEADYICVLHPLSYLIKQSNFKMLKAFTANYCLIDGIIINSAEFEQTSRSGFPIIVALYKRGKGMSYEELSNLRLPTKEGNEFCLSALTSISPYIDKYPNKNSFSDVPCAFFWTLRDINALKRNRTFLQQDSPQAVRVSLEKLPYYCYIDVFKTFTCKMPYFIGNCDVFLNHEEFLKIAHCFMLDSLTRHPWLPVKPQADSSFSTKIAQYFDNLLQSKIHIKDTL